MFKKLNTTGFAHHMAIVLVVLVIGIGGTFWLIKEHADSCTAGSVTGVSVTSTGSCTGSASGSVTSPGSSPTQKTGWTLLETGVTKQTEEQIFACVKETSPTAWTVNALATLVPAVSDSRQYDAAIIVGNTSHGGASSSNLWWLNEVTEISAGLNPQTQPPITVTPSLTAPKNYPFIKGGGGGTYSPLDLDLCS